MSDFLKSLIKDVIIAALLAAAVLYFVRPTIVQQTSMQPTMNPNDYIIIYKQAYRSEGPARGDIIVFESALKDDRGNDKLLIKRVIGLPGDVITIRDDQLYLNGEAYQEDYLKDGITTGLIEDLTVPDGQYFCMGDNRVSSIDSRDDSVGFVKRSQIRGKAVLRLFPFNRIQTF